MTNKPIISEYQVAIFPKDYKIDKVGEIAAKLMRLKEYFDADTVTMNPFDMSFPPEIERVSIFSPDKKIKLSISPKKLAFYWSNLDLDGKYSFDEKKNLSLITKVMETLKLTQSSIQRVGFITTVIKRDENPSELIKDSLLKNNIENTITNAQLKITYKTELEIFDKCNLHVTLVSGYLNDDKDDKVASLQFDLNTHQEEILDWDIENVGKFIEQANNKLELDSIYRAFFLNKDDGTKI